MFGADFRLLKARVLATRDQLGEAVRTLKETVSQQEFKLAPAPQRMQVYMGAVLLNRFGLVLIRWCRVGAIAWQTRKA